MKRTSQKKASTTVIEKLEGLGNGAIDKVKELVAAGKVRKIMVRNGTKTVASFPLAAGMVGVAFAPILSAIATLIALGTGCSIVIVKKE